VVQVARSSGLVDEGVFSTVIAASLISILLNVFVVKAVFRWTEPDASRRKRVGGHIYEGIANLQEAER